MYSNIDFLIVGAGMYGSTIARLLTDAGFNCLIIEKRNHLGGNCYSIPHESGLYDIHIYGPHTFHTSDLQVIEFISNYSKFEMYQQNTLANDGNKFYCLPFNMYTFKDLFDTYTPQDAYNKIQLEIKEANEIYKNRNDLEAVANKLVGKTIFNTLIKHYTEKQWNKKCSELDGNIIKRLPLRFIYNNDYFDNLFYGIPTEGYGKMFENIINGIGYDNKSRKSIFYILNVNFNDNIDFWAKIPSKNIIYCGAIDELFNYKLGDLGWNNLKFEHSKYEFNGINGQGCSVIHFTGPEPKANRKI